MHLVQILPRRWRELPREFAKFGTLGVANLNRMLPKRLQGISNEVAKFGVIGVINVVVNLAVFNVLLRTVLDNGEVKAKAIATIVATTCAYFMNRHWTYRDRPKSTMRREYTLFLFFNAVGLVIEVAVVWIAKYGFGQTSDLVFNICTGIGIVLGTIFRFWAYRNHVFKLGADTGEAEEPALVSAAAALATVPDPAMVDGSTDDKTTTPTNGIAIANSSVPAGHTAPAHDAAPAPANGVAPANGKRKTKRPANGAANGTLEAELTQIELDDIVASEQTSTRPL